MKLQILKGYLQRLLAPLKLLYHGHVYYLIYLIITIGASLGAIYGINYLLTEWVITFQNEYQQTSSFLKYLYFGALIIIVSIWVPLLLTAICLPVRNIFISKEITLGRLITITVPCFQNCLRSFFPMAWRMLGILIPPVAMLFGYFFWAAELPSSVQQIFLVTCIATIIHAAIRALPLIFTPIIAVCGHYQPGYACEVSNALFGSKRYSTFLTIVGTLALLALSISVLKYIPNWKIQVMILTFITWYLLTQAAITSTLLCAEMEYKQFNEEKVG